MGSKASSESGSSWPFPLNFTYAVDRSYTSKDYVNSSSPGYIYYVRKHNGAVIHDAIASVPSRLARIRNFNDFAVDVNASALPQWVWVTPNMINDGHDTTIDYAAAFIEYWLVPLLSNTNVNDNKTLIVLSFDENESYTENNQILTLLLGGAVPESARGTNDSTYYTHYSLLSTVQANWGLKSLGRGDTNKYVSHCSLIPACPTYIPRCPIGPSRTCSHSWLKPQVTRTRTRPAPISRSLTRRVRQLARSIHSYTCPLLRRTFPPSAQAADPSSLHPA